MIQRVVERKPLNNVAGVFHVAMSADGRLGVAAQLRPKNLIPLAHVEHGWAFGNSLTFFGQDVGGGRILVRQKITQSDLAAMAGIARENVSRILKEWSRQSHVSRLAGYYCLENKAALEREAEL